MLCEALKFFSSFIVNIGMESHSLLPENSIRIPLTSLVRRAYQTARNFKETNVHAVQIKNQIEIEVMQLVNTIFRKLEFFPQHVELFFETPARPQSSGHLVEFPILNCIVDYVHLPTQVGQIARESMILAAAISAQNKALEEILLGHYVAKRQKNLSLKEPTGRNLIDVLVANFHQVVQLTASQQDDYFAFLHHFCLALPAQSSVFPHLQVCLNDIIEKDSKSNASAHKRDAKEESLVLAAHRLLEETLLSPTSPIFKDQAKIPSNFGFQASSSAKLSEYPQHSIILTQLQAYLKQEHHNVQFQSETFDSSSGQTMDWVFDPLVKETIDTFIRSSITHFSESTRADPTLITLSHSFDEIRETQLAWTDQAGSYVALRFNEISHVLDLMDRATPATLYTSKESSPAISLDLFVQVWRSELEIANDLGPSPPLHSELVRCLCDFWRSIALHLNSAWLRWLLFHSHVLRLETISKVPSSLILDPLHILNVLDTSFIFPTNKMRDIYIVRGNASSRQALLFKT
jgi:hypothetical protein